MALTGIRFEPDAGTPLTAEGGASLLATVPRVDATGRGPGLSHHPGQREADRDDAGGEDEALSGRQLVRDPEQDDPADEQNQEHDEVEHVEAFQIFG